jgi:Na+/H+ antiporter NhaD/arsenite permease-like protein
MFNIFLAVSIFVLSYLAIITDIFPPAIASILGATFMVVTGVISGEEAVMSVDFEVILLIIGMMVIVDIIASTGVFEWVAIKAAQLVKGDPLKLLILLSLITAGFSAFLDNVTTVIVIVPVSILLANQLGLNPIPFVISESIASNIGGSSTLIGDPPNMLIASYSDYSFNEFLFHLGPIALVNMMIFILICVILFKKNMKIPRHKVALIMEMDADKSIKSKIAVKKYVSIFFLVILGFLSNRYINISPALVAVIGASIIIILSKEKPEKILSNIDWSTILFFIGLFVLVGGISKVGALKYLSNSVLKLTEGSFKKTSLAILWISNVVSAFLDNIPFTATVAPMLKESIIPAISEINKDINPQTIGYAMWWALSLGACLGGNATLVGSSANIVSVNISNRSGYKISFWDFTKYGVIFTVTTGIASTIYIWIRYL